MRLVCISDVHEQWENLVLPDGDVLICAGDLTFRGSLGAIELFAEWMQKQTHKHKITILGNHEVFTKFGGKSDEKEAFKIIRDHGITLLHDSGILIDGINFWGSPYTPKYGNWAYWYNRGEEAVKQWSRIPDNTNVIITHGPPYNILDRAPRGNNEFEHVGCQALLDRITELKDLKLSVFGHIHFDSNILEKNGVKFVNAAICDEAYNPVNPPKVIEI